MNEKTGKTIDALKRNGFEVYYELTAESASGLVQNLIPKAATIGIGDSASVRQTGVIDALYKEGRTMINPMSDLIVSLLNSGECSAEQHRRISQMAMMCDYFLTGTNAVTENGELINTDAAGNRVAGMFFGPQKVILMIGTNKIVENIEAGIARIRNICAPQHAKTKTRKTPCAVKGECFNCNSPERLCRVTSIIEKKPTKTDITIVLIEQDLGLGWDASWNQERIDRIYNRYADVTLIRRPEWLS